LLQSQTGKGVVSLRIRSRALSIAWKVVLLVFCAWGLLDGSGILAGAYTTAFPHMFTNISKLFAWVYFACAVVWLVARRDDPEAVTFCPVAKYTATVSLLVTMIIGHFMLFDALFQDGRLVMHLVVLHYVVPIMTLLDWLLFDEKGRMPAWGPVSWLSLVVAYLVVVFVRVGMLGHYMGGGTTADVTAYPYTFLDPGIMGAGGVAGFVAAMFLAFLVLGYVIFGLDRLLGRRR